MIRFLYELFTGRCFIHKDTNLQATFVPGMGRYDAIEGAACSKCEANVYVEDRGAKGDGE
jgi:hypothetical protein